MTLKGRVHLETRSSPRDRAAEISPDGTFLHHSAMFSKAERLFEPRSSQIAQICTRFNSLDTEVTELEGVER